eukprot:CAMPEP_0194046498 /NCGR_PEP_ID=MMETSP0009_2-20130614/21305_1 /TAXON_ID=210454 /ORGANISM="Grammatophora oceanica, Strain CCMP 410" /LENGTH=388 /DNA_ID=CAMNT_0038691813 /DNA_START=251 /DNA_END=1417 /DNA_ORIENTATION=+
MTKTTTPISNKTVDDKMTWQDLVKASFAAPSDGQYKNFMRRSLQAVVLYETQRCCKDRLPALRPFQRKIAFFDMAKALVCTLGSDDTFLTSEQQAQILWRNNASQELMDENNCWNRRKMILQEMENINKDMKELMQAGRTQEEALKEYLQQKFTRKQEEVSSNGAGTDDKTKKNDAATTPPPRFFYNHNHVLPCYALYYMNGAPNEEGLPAPSPPKTLLVTPKKPINLVVKIKKKNNKNGNGVDQKMAKLALNALDEDEVMVDKDDGNEDKEGEEEDWDVVGEAPPLAKHGAAGLGPCNKMGKMGGKGFRPLQRRMMVLQSIKFHMDLLKDFEGVVPQEELDERKRELYTRLNNLGTGGRGMRKMMMQKNKAAAACGGATRRAPDMQI